MSTPALLCAALEVALNRYLRQEPTVLAEWSRLEGRCVALEASDLGWRFLIEPVAGGVRVSGDAGLQPAVTVRATTAQVLSAALRNLGSEQTVLPAGLRIDGDAELLDRFARLLRRVGFDIEEPLARVFGDSAAHRIADGLRGLLGWGRSAGRRLALDTAEYLREEARELAGAAEVEEWMHEVETLREGVDRLEARLVRLERSARKERTA
jgi:ubiquinone biosynthesis protein UbiJ